MNAHELLATVEARGGVATVRRDGGAAVLNVAPRSLALELLPDLQKFKPALLEMLGADARIVTSAGAAAAPPARTDIVEYIRAKSAGYWARQRIHAEVTRRMNQADRDELARLVRALDNGEEIE